IEQNLLPTRAVSSLTTFRGIVSSLSEKAYDFAQPLTEVVKAAIIDTGYERMLKEEKTEEAEGRLLNLEELVNAAVESEMRGETMRDFLDHAALVSDTDGYRAEAQVTLMTMHSAKGLEFPAVFIAGLEENLFPHSRVSDNDNELEEERRLCYVAVTRAERYLYLTHAMKRRVYGEELPSEPSRFLNEFPLDLIEDLSTLPSWLRFAKKQSTRENRQVLQALKSSVENQGYESPRRTSNYQGPKNNSADSVREFFGRQGKKVDGSILDRSAREGEGSGQGSQAGLKVGTRVRHEKYGQGLIVRREGEGENAKLTINFPGYGQKKMIEKYASLEIIS
ncbi:MAG: ATP-binding domain-containing protein, partial [Blastocatellia bacterium]|nr:ATP-binding domain-containing protein [Blastocatellia bacterium]